MEFLDHILYLFEIFNVNFQEAGVLAGVDGLDVGRSYFVLDDLVVEEGLEIVSEGRVCGLAEIEILWNGVIVDSKQMVPWDVLEEFDVLQKLLFGSVEVLYQLSIPNYLPFSILELFEIICTCDYVLPPHISDTEVFLVLGSFLVESVFGEDGLGELEDGSLSAGGFAFLDVFAL